MKENVKELMKTMHDMAGEFEECLSLLQAAFIYNSLKPLHECNEIIESVKKNNPGLTDNITDAARDNPDLKPYVPVPAHLFRIAEDIEKLSWIIEKKIKGRILFSEKAVTEVTFLLQRLADILKPASDIILAKNYFLSRYIMESEKGVINRASEYATLHEERLIEGLCLQVASSLYINMLDSIKNIAWNAKEIADKLVGWMLPKAG